jgi:UDP-N-acetylmuramate dehydrogenase
MTAIAAMERPVARAAGARRTGTYQDLFRRLQEIAPAKRDHLLARHTTFGIGGPADIFVTVRSATELAAAVRAARADGAPLFILGSGSNILIGDGGIRGVVIDNQAKATRVAPLRLDAGATVTRPPLLDGVTDDAAAMVWAESGASFAALARHLARDGYGGIEWASGIPGSVGGAVVYNAGAYGGSTSDVLLAATVLDESGAERHLPAQELGLAYRTSAILRGEMPGAVVLSAEMALVKGDPEALTARVGQIDAERLAAQPRGRTGGSTFKNPEGRHAWELIDAVGLRGARHGDAQISEKHCNFFINTGAARAADVYALMQDARRRVRDRFGIELENEVALVGEGFE